MLLKWKRPNIISHENNKPKLQKQGPRTTKANTTRDNMHTRHTNKYIEHDPSKRTIKSMRAKVVDEYANAQTTSVRNRIFEKAKKRTKISISLV